MKWNKEGEMLPSKEVRCVVADDHGWEKLYVGQQAGKVYITKWYISDAPDELDWSQKLTVNGAKELAQALLHFAEKVEKVQEKK